MPDVAYLPCFRATGKHINDPISYRNATNNGAEYNNQLLTFDPANSEYIAIPSLTEGDSEFTLVYLFRRPSSVDTAAPLISEIVGAYWQNYINYLPGGTLSWFTRDTSTGTTGSRNNDLSVSAPTYDTWYSLAFRYSVSMADKSIWYNGIQQGSTSTSIDTMNTGYTDTYIGRNLNIYLRADIRYFLYYNKALSDLQIKDLYINPYIPFQKNDLWMYDYNEPAAGVSMPVLMQAHRRRIA